eukprot:EW704850.1.p2 GENE.EW704850.1~~EW704850.1.p2  ORF type:complete len:73 (+),score=29.40 EW704850.1:45-263(+)
MSSAAAKTIGAEFKSLPRWNQGVAFFGALFLAKVASEYSKRAKGITHEKGYVSVKPPTYPSPYASHNAGAHH